MSIFWLQPVAWWGLAALAAPVLIHLLARQRRRRVPFPSLRFLRVARPAASKRYLVSDWPLLVVRMLILGAAVTALAAPVLVSSTRSEAWSRRIARAIVIAPASSRQGNPLPEAQVLVDDGRRDSFVSAVFAPTGIADGLRDASEWLAEQPPARREVVVVGDLRAGDLAARDLAVVPTATGIRFLPVVSNDPGRQVRMTTTAPHERPGTSQELLVTLEDDTTRVASQPVSIVTPEIEVRAIAGDQAHAEAALRAVLAEGVLLPRARDRRVVIEFDGVSSETVVPREMWMRLALERLADLSGGETSGRLVVRAGLSGADPHAARVIQRVASIVFADSLRDVEPRRIAAQTLARWSRPPGPVPETAAPGNEGDQRLVWVVALALLGVEQLVRRKPNGLASRDDSADSSSPEARVA